MPLPVDIQTIIVTGYCTDIHGGPADGQVVFTPSSPLSDVTGQIVIGNAPVPVPLVEGRFSVVLPCTDSATLNPTSFAYMVTKQFNGGGVPYLVQLPHTLGSTVDLASLAPTNPPTPYSTIYGVLAGDNAWAGHNAFAMAPTGPTPTSGTQLATKGYVDATSGGAPVLSVNGLTGAVVLAAADVSAISTAAAGAASGVATLDSGSHLPAAQLPLSALTATSAAGGDASGTLAALHVDKLQGITITGTPAAGKILVLTGATTAQWQTPAAGNSPTVRQAYVTAGEVTFNSDAAFTLYPAIELAIPAAVGDWVELAVGGMWQPPGGFIDWAVVVSSSAVRYCSSGTGTPCVEGDPGWYPGSGFRTGPGVFAFAVASGDLDGGSVRFQVAHKGSAGGVLYSNANYPLRLRALNLHAVT